MNYSEAREYLDQVSVKGNKLGLEAITVLMHHLNDPQDNLKFIHIAGTNGKGSVMAYLEEILIRAGYRVGRYISPCLFCYEEKIRVNNEMISKEDVARLTSVVASARRSIAAENGPETTIFEVETAISFLYFQERGCDVVLLETGMGGRDDATNLVNTTILEIFSSISLDHMEFLGNTTAEIAAVKAGIIKEGVPAVSDRQDEGAAASLQAEAIRRHAGITFADPQQITDVRFEICHQTFSYRKRKDVVIRLNGTYQIRNAAVALDAADELIRQGFRISEDNIREGMENASWSGRFELVHTGPSVIMDGAHNPDAARVLMDSISAYFQNRKIYYIFGVFSDKEYDKIIDITVRRASRIYTVQTQDNPRALPAQILMQKVKKVNPDVVCAYRVPAALDMALKEASKEDVIVVFGSLSFLYEVRNYFMISGS